MGELAAKRRLELAEQELAEATAALSRAQDDPAERRRKGVASPQGAASRTRAGRVRLMTPLALLLLCNFINSCAYSSPCVCCLTVQSLHCH